VPSRNYPHALPTQTIGDTRFVAIDFEAAGAAKGMTDAPVQVGVATMVNGEIERETFFRSYIKPSHEVAWTARRVHGIGPETVDASPSFGELWPELKRQLSGAVMVAHGAPTEKRYLRLFPGHGFGPWVDTLWVARKVIPEAESHRLGGLVDLLGVGGQLSDFCPGLQWHDALYDAVASLVILKAIIDGAKIAEKPLGWICPEIPIAK